MHTLSLGADGCVWNFQHVACGRVVRDTKGNWMMGFHKNLRACSVTNVKILAIKVGIEVCQDLNLGKISIHSNSIEAINTLRRDNPLDHHLRDAIDYIRDQLFLMHDVELHHSHRDIIRCMDFMARQGHNGPPTTTLVPHVLVNCLSMYLEDKNHL
ncbi:uncharacterized protein LOC129289866 [Prosopis cineraria]|uniref:uncharacterized protein LOC129289866 n=1 Tax=Prosopis cineraria TaxID=364024 RepID=UPI00240F0BEC|nr:uncharacterized protein LOC129289866 [Prosopis cineraria]